MAAGQGFIEFSTGDILTAAAANGYLASQVVMVFADAAARTTAIASPQEGMISYLKDTNATQYYSGSAWVNIGGGASPLTTKGDIYTYSTTDARLPVGTNGQVLTADSTAATGLAWATAAAAGGMTLINTGGTALSGATTTVSTIPSGYKHLFVVYEKVSMTDNVGESVNVRLNGDSGNNYTYQTIMSSNTTLTGRGDLNNPLFEVGVRSTTGTDVQYQGYGQVWIRLYTQSGGIGVSWQASSTTGGTATPVSCVGSGSYDGSAAITSVALNCGSTTFSSGRVYVYGVN